MSKIQDSRMNVISSMITQWYSQQIRLIGYNRSIFRFTYSKKRPQYVYRAVFYSPLRHVRSNTCPIFSSYVKYATTSQAKFCTIPHIKSFADE